MSEQEKPKCDHEVVFLRQENKELGYRYMVKEDVFFCSKCLSYQRVKVWDSRDDR